MTYSQRRVLTVPLTHSTRAEGNTNTKPVPIGIDEHKIRDLKRVDVRIGALIRFGLPRISQRTNWPIASLNEWPKNEPTNSYLAHTHLCMTLSALDFVLDSARLYVDSPIENRDNA